MIEVTKKFQINGTSTLNYISNVCPLICLAIGQQRRRPFLSASGQTLVYLLLIESCKVIIKSVLYLGSTICVCSITLTTQA
ncbi:hypothetical protein GDO81_002983 [Engystomops pustulosus]|uniref:Uncharacterized protein n=1 Tax=Engystomops pustulosus TaxID=76066 RepID=A0AAV7DP29_ENGPU|nr:hypothetical protein GDO81_002983 [Engystomops pustulosus]